MVEPHYLWSWTHKSLQQLKSRNCGSDSSGLLCFNWSRSGLVGILEGIAEGLPASPNWTPCGSASAPKTSSRRLLAYNFGNPRIGLALRASHVLLARVTTWLGRGVRTRGRKDLLAAGVAAEAWGRALGFERMCVRNVTSSDQIIVLS